MPFLLLLDEHEGGYKAGRFLRASDLGDTTPHAEWKPVIYDENKNEITVPNGTMGQRWEPGKKWNLILEREDGSVIAPALSVESQGAERQTICFPFFDNNANGTFERQIPAKKIQLADGTERLVATVYDLMLSQYGIVSTDSGSQGGGYDDADSFYTPAWQEKITGVKASIVVQIAREFAQNALDTGGRSMIIMGAGINHWFNSDTIYRSILNLVILTASQGVNGGGWAHYVGQEKCRPIEG
ncbi:hypothetical protein BGX30_008640, partial [Mortierella sp. GBA39]